MTKRKRKPIIDTATGLMADGAPVVPPALERMIQREGAAFPVAQPTAVSDPPASPGAACASMFVEPEPGPDDIGKSSTGRRWSDQQEAIFSWFARKELRFKSPKYQHLVVRARAGTGKTTTIIEAIGRAPESPILLAAFNKSIATELQERLRNPNAEAATLHSVGFRCVRRYWDNLRVDDNRARDLAEAVCDGRTPDPIKRLVAKLHTKGREILPHAETASDLRQLAVAFDCAPDDEWRHAGFGLTFVCERAIEAMRQAAEIKPANGIDFADMLYLPVRNGWMHPRYALIVIDEAQDMSAVQLELARGMLVRGGRMAVVGDDRQAVYGFRGADSTALDRLKEELSAAEMGLNTTYRCGKAIVAEAQRLVPDIEAHTTNGDGRVRTTELQELLDHAAADDFVLSRVNAPLVKVALTLIRLGRRTRIQGRDIGANLKALVRKLTQGNSVMSMGEWLQRLGEWERKEAQKAEEAELPSKVEFVHDQAETLRALADDALNIREIEARIDSLFGDTGYGYIVCSSVHRAKGLEADRVWLLKSTFYPQVTCVCGHRHQWRKQACGRCKCQTYRPEKARQQEEHNIGYVAITRAKKELVWVA